MQKLLGEKKIHIPKRPGEPDRSKADIKKLKKKLKWKPNISIRQGINELLKNIHYWSDAPIWTPKSIKKETKVWFKLLKNNQMGFKIVRLQAIYSKKYIEKIYFENKSLQNESYQRQNTFFMNLVMDMPVKLLLRILGNLGIKQR